MFLGQEVHFYMVNIAYYTEFPNLQLRAETTHLLRFTHFLEILGQKKCLFGSKTVFLGQEVHHYMVYIAYFTELNLQICDYAQK